MSDQVLDVTCAVIISRRKVLIVRKGPSMKMPGKYEFPGGKLEADESEEDCITREIREELGIEIDIIKRLIPSVYQYESGSVNLIPFLCTYAEGEITLIEHDLFHWIEPQILLDFEWCGADIAVCEQVINLDLSTWS